MMTLFCFLYFGVMFKLNQLEFGIKCYLCCKPTTSQNVSFEAQVKHLFISYKSYVPFSVYSSFCTINYPMIYQTYDVMMSISTQNKVHFWL